MSPPRTALYIVVGAAGWIGCVRSTPPAAVSIPAALPPRPSTTVASTLGAYRPQRIAAHEEADFSSDHGLVHLRSDGAGRVSGSYPNGVLVCTSEDEARLECEWTESSSQGRASFVARGDGGYDGTWGNDKSATDGGSWALARVVSRAGLDGLYDTNWGAATVRDGGPTIHVDYARGTMDCQRRASQLDCAWTEGGTTGRAELSVEPNGVLRGRWGNGPSSTDGGAWVFVKR